MFKILLILGAAFSTAAIADIQLNDLDVTEGKISSAGNQLTVNVAQMRAVLRKYTSPQATLIFVYHGPSSLVSHLDNGEVRHQFGLKLKARDACNLVYIMWDFDAQRIRVSVKSNPSQCSYLQCADRGYISMTPAIWAKPPVVQIDEQHVLRATIRGNDLTVIADDITVWEGTLVKVAENIDGPIGLRSDNVNATFSFRSTL